ncbi:DUF5994 family protein [Streptomyces aurantiogriseus]|uniref:Uncharacterized protein n=1 Tax=Streptomyces aurantiogriseus TaxID=66870 RepID=A0A918F112_9ACTN|nr:DUF5994 family protein [Streptomyces aurantiogriseus]GGQ91580.1 hypothetical protein GCM10010251_02540 [Streptomyces aurantiogriseus]
MPRTDPPPTAGFLPDGIHESVRPGTALVRLETTHDRRGVLDGAWWPRSRDVTTELPGLITALAEHLGPVTRVGLDSAAWDGLPTRLVIDGRVVHIDASSVGDDTVLITRGDQDLFSLLVVPPDSPPRAAWAAMAEAVRADNIKEAGRILLDTGAEPLGPSGRGPVAP